MPSKNYIKKGIIIDLCRKCGAKYEKQSNGQMYCKKCTPSTEYQRKPLLHKVCVICKTHFETNKPFKVVCRREYCRIKQKRINAAASYIKRKTERVAGENSTCPKCGKKFNGSAKYEYCHLHSWIQKKSDYGTEYSLGTR